MRAFRFSPPRYVQDIASRLTQLNGAPHYVGGAVRDAIIGREPHDYDIASALHPSAVQLAFDNVVPTGARHGTVTVVTNDGNVEVTTFRSESTYADGRHPDAVAFVPSIELDLQRRDFTMNAVAINAANGTLVDPHAGVRDALDGIVRTVGDPSVRFAEDGLRVMRAVRFAAQLGFTIESKTLTALRPEALVGVSSERIRDELTKVLDSDRPELGITLLSNVGILKHIIGESMAQAFLTASPRLAAIDARLRLAACSASAGSDPGRELARTLKVDVHSAQLATNAARALIMLRSDSTQCGVRAALAQLGREAVVIAASLEHDETTVMTSLTAPIITAKELPFNGNDVMSKLGVAGAAVGRVIRNAINAAVREPCLLADSDKLLAIARLQ